MYAKSPARDIGVGLMCFHEFVAFGLFAGPLWHMWEKFLHVDKSHYLVRTASRYIVNAFMVLFAVMFPFFGVINSVRLGVEPADVAWRGGGRVFHTGARRLHDDVLQLPHPGAGLEPLL